MESGDAGRYTCNVTNGIGSPTDASAFLAVECECDLCFRCEEKDPRKLHMVSNMTTVVSFSYSLDASAMIMSSLVLFYCTTVLGKVAEVPLISI